MKTQKLKEKHIILRSIGAITRDVFDGGASSFPSSGAASFPNLVESATASTAGLSVEIKDIDRDNISALTRNSDVLAVAPSIPMKLIEPLEIEDVAEPIATDLAWGVKAVGADTSPFSGKGIVVAVLDTGIDASHPAFSGIRIIQKDFTGEGDGDQNGHGTHCAGTIFGRAIAGSTRIGIAPGVEKVLIGKVIGKNGGSSDQIVSAIQWAVDNGANVISMSLGMDFPGLVKQLEQNGFPSELAASRALEGYRTNILLFERLAALVRAQGAFLQTTIIVAAAGNESQRNINPKFEISVSPPAVSEGIISVGALGEGPQGLTIADFSNTGPNISGPGVKILSAKAGGGFTLMSGTSMATPHVAGVAALWAEKINAFGNLNPLQLTARIIASGTNDGLKAGFDSFDTGAGLVRAPQV